VTDFKNSNNGKTFAVRADDEPLYVEVSDGVTGWCMDVMNPRFVSDFLEPKLLRTSNLQSVYSGVWLEANAPYIRNTTHKFKDPWDDIPYRPAGGYSTLPEQAQHDTSGQGGHYETHNSLHGVFGATFAKSVIANMPTFRTQLQRPLVISDSTFAGLGQYGAAHFLPGSEEGASLADLRRSLLSLLNYGMFGMPNVGPRLCDFRPDGTFDDFICGKYFQMAIFSPLALYSDKMSDLKHHPYLANNTMDTYWYA
jgi:alpha-glucosidase (family GH31 glycosyl hydrolase)